VTETIDTERLRLELLTAEKMEQLFRAPPPWMRRGLVRFARMRLEKLRADAAERPWAPRLILLRDDSSTTVGHAGFHGKPGTNAINSPNAVEIGYSIFEPYRRQGYATEAVRALIDWAQRQPGVERIIASISPTNEPSLAIARRFGFVEIGRHWDDEDGEELEFELVGGAA
jgi:[ribosomal protein S5]-alanine N-acetyltransferase